MNPDSVLSHTSAARLWKIPLPAQEENDWRIHLANPPKSRAPRRVNVVGHSMILALEDVRELDGVRLTSPSRTWLDLAAMLRLEDLVVAGDFLVCSHGPGFPVPRAAACRVEDLARGISGHPGMRGLRNARAALDLVRVGADSPPETHMRLALVRAGLPEPELNVVLRDPTGKPVVWPDAAYRKHRISLQYDGLHHDGAGQYPRDIRRHEATRMLGWTEVRLGREDLSGDRPAVVRKVRQALHAAGWVPG
ncbi:hypothetical protein [Specibacter sp. RAF43]|uniref:hypothetical protein n=1 Tax=Specibacter sp. RAF43 TaxID=3233057 RepID=UPI003F99CD26